MPLYIFYKVNTENLYFIGVLNVMLYFGNYVSYTYNKAGYRRRNTQAYPDCIRFTFCHLHLINLIIASFNHHRHLFKFKKDSICQFLKKYSICHGKSKVIGWPG